MTREEIINATGRITDLHIFYDILTSGTPGAERLFNAIEYFKISNPMMLASYLLSNKVDIMAYCDDQAAEINTAKTCMLMYAAELDGKTESKDNALTSITDGKYHVYDFVWNKAIHYSPEDAIKVLTGIPYGDRVDFMKDLISIFMAGGGATEKDQELIDHLNSVFKINVGDRFKPLAKSDAPLEKRTATINSVTADHNVIVNGQKGVTLHINLDIVHCKGVDCKCGAWLYYANGNPVKDTNNKYYSPDGQVAASVPFKPGYDDTHYGDLQLFFPYDEFHIEGKNVSCYLSLQIYCSDTGEFISNFFKNNMTYSSGDKKTPLEKRTATINSVTADHNVIVNGQKGVTLHINLDIVHCKGVDCKCGAWLYYANGNPVKDTNNKYYSPDGQVAASVPFKPGYDDTHYGDLQLFFPYDEFHIEGKNVSCYLSLQIYCSDTGEFISNFYKNNMTYSSGR